MPSQNAALELLERELQQCTARASELRRAIKVLKESEGITAKKSNSAAGRGESASGGPTTKDLAEKVLREHPDGMSSDELFHAIRSEGGTIKDQNGLNGILRRHENVFARHPDLPRYWVLRQNQIQIE